jgi:hypothetical protein
VIRVPGRTRQPVAPRRASATRVGRPDGFYELIADRSSHAILGFMAAQKVGCTT